MSLFSKKRTQKAIRKAKDIRKTIRALREREMANIAILYISVQ